MQITIRRERPEDKDAIYEVEQAAFGRTEEPDLVNRLRDQGVAWVSHVAEIDGDIVGHALYSMVTVTDGETVHQFPALAPLAVLPEYQSQGVGGKLMEAGIDAARNADYGMMFLIGQPDYYQRFGFQPAQPLGFTSDYVQDNGPHEHFMVNVFDDDLLKTVKGHVRYHPAFEGI